MRNPATLGDADSVARATMELVSGNIERLVERLQSHGYQFGVYPDGTRVPGVSGAHTRPEAGSLAHLGEIEGLIGTIPLSLRAFWQIVGSISLIGRTPEGWPDYTDPLVVDPPEAALAQFHERYADLESAGSGARHPFLCAVAPDVLHKDNVSGGAPYSIRLPDAGADATVREEWHNVNFVAYLRIAILDWGGFPGLSQSNPLDKWRAEDRGLVAPEWLKELTHDLVSF